MGTDFPGILDNYYHLVDKTTRIQDNQFIVDPDKVEQIVDMFADDASYHRERFPTISGKADIGDFFLYERSLAGKHKTTSQELVSGVAESIAHSFQSNKDVKTYIYHGEYTGQLCITDMHDNSLSRKIKGQLPADLRYDDYWVVDDNDKVIFRQSDIIPLKYQSAGQATQSPDNLKYYLMR